MGQDQYKHLNPDNYQCEQIEVPSRQGVKIPVLITYHKKFYNDKSPWIIFTKGAESSKNDFEFKKQKMWVMDRGMVVCYPMVRGKYRLILRHEILRR